MRYVDLYRMTRRTHASMSPKPWHTVPCVTGDYDLDATIGHSANKDMAEKLEMYTAGYSPRTGYSPYGKGDD